MQIKISTKGQVVVPNRIRRKLNLQPGDSLEAKLERQRIVLTRQGSHPRKPRIVRDPVTGLPVLTAGPRAPKLTSVQVHEFLVDLPCL